MTDGKDKLLDSLKFFGELNALQIALLDPLITEVEEDAISSEIKELVRKRGEAIKPTARS